MSPLAQLFEVLQLIFHRSRQGQGEGTSKVLVTVSYLVDDAAGFSQRCLLDEVFELVGDPRKGRSDQQGAPAGLDLSASFLGDGLPAGPTRHAGAAKLENDPGPAHALAPAKTALRKSNWCCQALGAASSQGKRW